jgi:pyridoxamine 5'-phosphate oxidase
MIDSKKIAGIRKDYALREFDETHVKPNPIIQFNEWFNEALVAEVIEPNAMTLATVGFDGKPCARIVLLKGIEENGFIFYTNYDSNKGKQLRTNPYAALVFFWPELQRQVRIEGEVKRIPEKDADAYFLSRPFESQVGAHASNQSQPIENREVLENEFIRLKAIFSIEPPVRPKHWGGFIVIAHKIEFWQGRSSRLHDRFEFTFSNGAWVNKRLSP